MIPTFGLKPLLVAVALAGHHPAHPPALSLLPPNVVALLTAEQRAMVEKRVAEFWANQAARPGRRPLAPWEIAPTPAEMAEWAKQFNKQQRQILEKQLEKLRAGRKRWEARRDGDFAERMIKDIKEMEAKVEKQIEKLR